MKQSQNIEITFLHCSKPKLGFPKSQSSALSYLSVYLNLSDGVAGVFVFFLYFLVFFVNFHFNHILQMFIAMLDLKVVKVCPRVVAERLSVKRTVRDLGSE